jgi:hypothetical protein
LCCLWRKGSRQRRVIGRSMKAWNCMGEVAAKVGFGLHHLCRRLDLGTGKALCAGLLNALCA